MNKSYESYKNSSNPASVETNRQSSSEIINNLIVESSEIDID